jgi:WD40 repeat protein
MVVPHRQRQQRRHCTPLPLLILPASSYLIAVLSSASPLPSPSSFQVKLWDARIAEKSGLLVTLRHHKQAVSKVRWNRNGNWLLTCGADGKADVFDIRTGKEIYSAAAAAGITAAQWHPVNELVFATGTKEVQGRVGSSLEQWVVGYPEPQFQIHDAHHKKVCFLFVLFVLFARRPCACSR